LFQRKVSESKPGTTIRLGTFRERGSGYVDTVLTVQLEKAPISARDAEEFKDERLEMTVRDLVFSDFVIRNLESGSVEGVVVSSLESGGLAVVGGLEMGDIIQRIGSSSVTSVSAFQQVVTESLASGSKELIFFVWRDGRTQFVNVRLN
jgi:S1-C subfamily serine protease